jgi:WD40 repeat protein
MEGSKGTSSVALLSKPQIKSPQPRQVPTSFKSDFISLGKKIQELSPTFIRTPFKGTSLELIQRKAFQDSNQTQNSNLASPAKTSDQSKYFVFASKEGQVCIYDIDKKELIKEKNLDEGSISAIVITSDGKAIYTAGKDAVIRKWDLDTFEEDKKATLFLDKPKGDFTKLAISKANDILISAGEDKKILKWDLNTHDSKLLYKHKKPITSLDLSPEGTYVISSSDNESVIAYNTQKSGKFFSRDFRDKLIYHVKISSSSRYMAAAAAMGDIYLWAISNVEIEHVLSGHQDHVNCLHFSPDDRYLLSGAADNLVKVWDLTWQKEELTFFGHSDWVVGLSFSQNTVFSLSDDCTIMANNIQNFSNHHLVYQPGTAKQILPTSSGSRTFAVIDSRLHEYSNGRFSELESAKERVFFAKLVNRDSLLVVFLEVENTQFKVLSKNLETFTSQEKLMMSSSVLKAAEVTEDGKWLLTGEAFRVTVWDRESGSIVRTIRSHTSDVTALAVNSGYLFAGEENGVIKMYNMGLDFYEMGHLTAENTGAVNKIIVSNDRRYLVSATKYNQVFIWSTQTKTHLKQVNLKNAVEGLALSQDSSKLFFSHSNKLEIWNMDNFSKCSEMTEKFQITAFALRAKDSEVLIANPAYIKIIDNPLASNEFSLYGHYEGQSRLVQYLHKIFQGERPKYDESMNNWLIEPYHINLLHVYAFYNLTKHLERAIRSGGTFFPSRGNYTALSISVDKKLQDCVECLFENFKAQADNEPFVFYYFSSTLAALNKSSYPKLHLFYEMVYRKSLAPHLPKFCSDSVSLPIRTYSEHLFVDKEEMMPDQYYGRKEVAIEFYQSFVQLPIQFGSSESLEFMRSLIDCKNIDIFSSNLIRKFLEDKWKTARIILLVEGILYYLYLVMVCGYMISSEYKQVTRNRYELTAPMAINFLLFLNETLQMAYSRGKYFTSFWNYIDLTRFLLFTFYFVLIWLESEDILLFPSTESNSLFSDSSIKSYLLLSCVLFSLLRGSSYFRINSSTRWVVNLIFEVIYQLGALILVTLYSMLAFVVVYNYYSQSGFDEFISENHEIAEYEYFLIFVVLIINPIIMLNLFIAIVGETFEKSQDEKNVKNGQDLAEIIFEAELLFLCSRRLRNLQFIHEVREEHGDLLVQLTAGQRMKKISQSVEMLNENTARNKNEIAELTKFVKESIRAVQGKMDQIARRLN